MTPDDTLSQQPQEPTGNDPLQPQDDLFSPTRDQELLPEDGLPPAAPADDVPTTMSSEHPATDTDVDAQEVYDAGLDSVAEAPRNSGNLDGMREAREVEPLEPLDDTEQ